MNQGTQDVGISISAAGTTQGTATLLINGINVLSTVAVNSGAVLFASNLGTCQFVYNGGANSVKIYPPLGLQINGLGINNAHNLSPNTSCEYWTVSGTQIVALQSA